MLPPAISIAVPLFNKRDYIGDSLATVARQSFSDYEIVVVDDGSTDGSASIVKALDIPNLKLISQANAGVSAARNRCLAEASSEFVAFLDADDLWMPDHLKHLWNLHLAYPDARLLANSFWKVSNSSARDVLSPKANYRKLDDFFLGAATGRSWIFTSAAMVHRDACLSLGGFQVGESRGEDIDLWIRMAMQYPVADSDYVGCLYRRVEGSLTASVAVLEPDVAMRRIAEFLKRDDLNAERKHGLKELYNRIAIANATDCLALGERQAARKFLDLASDTKILRRRWQLVRMLSVLPPSMPAGLGKLRRWARTKKETT